MYTRRLRLITSTEHTPLPLTRYGNLSRHIVSLRGTHMSENSNRRSRGQRKAPAEAKPRSTRRRVRPSRVSAGGSTKVRIKALGAETETSEEEIHVFTSDPAYVRVNAGVTRNLGDYESLRVDVSISKPCYPEHIDKTFTELSDEVSDKLADEVERYLG